MPVIPANEAELWWDRGVIIDVDGPGQHLVVRRRHASAFSALVFRDMSQMRRSVCLSTYRKINGEQSSSAYTMHILIL